MRLSNVYIIPTRERAYAQQAGVQPRTLLTGKMLSQFKRYKMKVIDDKSQLYAAAYPICRDGETERWLVSVNLLGFTEAVRDEPFFFIDYLHILATTHRDCHAFWKLQP